MAAFLTSEWVAALSAALQAAGITTEGAPRVVVQQLVDHPDGMRSAYRIRLDSGGAEALAGHAADATVTYRQTYEVARGIANGDLDAHVEFLMGRIVVSGDTKALMDYRAALEGVHEALAGLRADTEF